MKKNHDAGSGNANWQQWITSLILPALCAALLFATFIALGTWQIKRLHWKQALIERVRQRIHAPAVAAPEPSHWNKITAESDEYRHVTVSGVFLDNLSTQVAASTILGRGFWVMTPLRLDYLDNGRIVFINRGFIPYGSIPCASDFGSAEVTGLLRISEPDSALFHSNNPAHQRWYSRDVAALAASKHLSNVAPFFIDAEPAEKANERLNKTGLDCTDPVPGLTVIAFHNNHLVYAITWYVMALMIVAACFIFWRTEHRSSA